MYFNNQIEETNIDSQFNNKNDLPKIPIKYILIGVGIVVFIAIIILIVVFGGNGSKLTLLGEQNMTIYMGTDYIEPGYVATNRKNEDLSNNVVINNMIDNNTIGSYEIKYSLGKKSITRYVEVVEKPVGATYMYLKGDLTLYIKLNETYNEPGYIVIDTVDSNLSNQVKINNTVNSKKIGTYHIVYSVVNSSGVTTSASRTVIVVGSEISLTLNPNTYTNGNVSINVTAIDNYFDYMILPNGTKTQNNNYEYKVSENGTYTFKAYNTKGSTKEASIKVETIDRTSPKGSCSGSFKSGTSTIKVNATDNIGINKYVVNGQTFSSNIISIKGELSKATVVIYDKAGNTQTVSCNLEDKNVIHYNKAFDVFSYKSSKNYEFSYWLSVPEGATDKMPLVVFLHGMNENGNDYNHKTDRGILWGPGNDIRDHGSVFKAILVMPQCPTSGCWSTTTLPSFKELIDKIAADYKVNTNKISISGFSNGCYGLITFVGMYNDYFSAAVPVGCPGSHPEYFKKIPVWAIGGDCNSEMDRFVQSINKLDGEAKHTFVPGRGHNVMNDAYSIYRDSNYNLIDWMISKNKK